MNKDTTAITVIVPVYKVEPWLRRCVDSVLAQTFADFELVLVDDGSPDRCGTICDEYAQKDPRVHVIHQTNGGLSAARNTGIERALSNGSQWLAFVDSDDEISPDYLSRLYEAASEHHADLSICDFRTVWSDGRTDGDPFAIPEMVTTGRELLAGNDIGRNWHFTLAWNKLYHCSLFVRLRFPVGYIHEDEAVIHRVLGAARSVVCIPDRLYIYYRRADSIMGNGRGLQSVDYLCALSDRIRWIPAGEFPGLYARAIQSYHKFYDEICIPALLRDGKGTIYPRRAARATRAILPDLLRSSLWSRGGKIKLLLFCFFPKLYLSVIKRRAGEG